MLFYRCRSVHTLGMRFTIDVVSLDEDFTVRGVHRLRPRRLLLPRLRTKHLVECAPGSPIEVGDRFRPEAERGQSGAGGRSPATL